jgi:hypothetical protein
MPSAGGSPAGTPPSQGARARCRSARRVAVSTMSIDSPTRPKRARCSIQRSRVTVISTITSTVAANSTIRPASPYSPVLRATRPTMANRKAPMKVARAVCALLSSINSLAARGVTVVVAIPKAETMALSEKVATTSIELARMERMLPTESAPKRSASPGSRLGLKKAPTRAATTPSAQYSAVRTHIRLDRRCSR